MVIYQSYTAIHTWLVEKPTSFSTTSRHITLEDLPSITICLQEGFDADKLKTAGYLSSWDYYYGELTYGNDSIDNSKRSPVSWNGKYGNVTFKDLVNVDQVVKYINLTVKNNDKEWRYIDEMSPNFERRILFEGLCFKLNMTSIKQKMEESKSSTLVSIDFNFNQTLINKFPIKFIIEDSNQVYYFLRQHYLVGPHLFPGKNTSKSFHIRSTVFKNIENCKRYNKISYSSCRYQEIQSMLSNLNCKSPFFQNYENITSKSNTCYENKNNIKRVLTDTSFDEFKTNCEDSCTTMEFHSSFSHDVPIGAKSQYLEIVFDSSVKVWTADYTTNGWTVLAVVGGAFGLWLGLGILQLTNIFLDILKRTKEKILAMKNNQKTIEV